jgi:L-ascorbate metabolism protein UlaG (beta-lactamase superfamily)
MLWWMLESTAIFRRKSSLFIMKVFWLGHSCFLLRSEQGPSVLLDPFHGEEVGYPLPSVRADIVTIRHDHEDHNNAEGVLGQPQIVRGPGRHSAGGLDISGIASCHNGDEGSLRGPNTIFCFALDGIRVCHLGDLGHVLSRGDVQAIGPVDLLFLPVGGIYTLDAEGAGLVMEQLSPALTVPMHYWTEDLGFELDPVDGFLEVGKVCCLTECLELREDSLPPAGTVALMHRSLGATDR